MNAGGWVLTNRHVVEGCKTVTVQGHGSPAALLIDTEADLALLHLPGARVTAPLSLRDAPARLAEDVVALGYPLTEALGGAIRATTGTVSARAGLRDDPRFIQISAPLQPGNSGGPVLDRSGAVIGIATAVLSEAAYAQAQNVNFAVTAAEARRFLAGAGIARVSAATHGPGDSLPDLVEAAAAATVLIGCTRDLEAGPPVTPDRPPQDTPVATPPTPPAAAETAPPYTRNGMVFHPDADVLGFDLRGVRGVTLERCEALCRSEGACAAFTWSEADRICFLKRDATLILRAPGATAAYVERLSARVLPTGQTLALDTATDAPAYDRHSPSSLTACFVACGIDPLCRAFSYEVGARACSLHAAPGLARDGPGVYLGRK